jgi:putative transcriptional regulator
VIVLPLKYKIDVVDALKAKGFYPQKIRKEKLLSESTMTKLRRGEPVSWENLEMICKLLECQPGDIIEYIDD